MLPQHFPCLCSPGRIDGFQAEEAAAPQPQQRCWKPWGWAARAAGAARREMARTRSRSLAIGDGANDVAMIQARLNAFHQTLRQARIKLHHIEPMYGGTCCSYKQCEPGRLCLRVSLYRVSGGWVC